MTKISIIDYLATIIIFTANIFLVRNFGLEIKGSFAQLLAISSIFFSIGMAGFNLVLPKIFDKFSLYELFFIAILPVLLLFLTHDIIIPNIEINIILLIFFALANSLISIFSVGLIIKNIFFLIFLNQLSLPISVLVLHVYDFKDPLTILLICFSTILLITVFLFTFFKEKKLAFDILKIYKEFTRSIKFLPYIFLSGAPSSLILVFFIDKIEDVAIFSIIISIAQIINKFPRLLMIKNISDRGHFLKNNHIIYFFLVVTLSSLVGAFAINIFYEISFDMFLIPFLIIIPSSFITIFISDSDSKSIRDNEVLAISIEKIISMLLFTISIVIFSNLSNLVQVSLAFVVFRIGNLILLWLRKKIF